MTTDREHLADLIRDVTGLLQDLAQRPGGSADASQVAPEYVLADQILAAGYRRGPARQLAQFDADQLGRASLTLRTVATALDLLAGDTR